MAKVKCDNCGVIFERQKSWVEGHKHHFCSVTCYQEWWSYNHFGKNSLNWKGGKIKRICEFCGTVFSVHPSLIKKRSGKFCSLECRNKWHSEHSMGNNNSQWKGGKIKRICEECGKEFEVYPSRIKRGRGRFCSRSCTSKAIRKLTKIPKYHTKPELIFEEICKKNDLPFQFVGDGQLWIGKRKKLNPDFVECNGKKICIEIMGDYWHSPLLNKKLREDALLFYRKRHYTRYHWKSVFIWESDLKREDAEEFVLSELKKL